MDEDKKYKLRKVLNQPPYIFHTTSLCEHITDDGTYVVIKQFR